MSWTCKHCDTLIEDDEFQICWNCSSDKTTGQLFEDPKSALPKCLRCDSTLKFVGTKNFHEGTRWGVLGELGEMFVNKESLDMFGCKSCGKVEFFISGFHNHLST